MGRGGQASPRWAGVSRPPQPKRNFLPVLSADASAPLPTPPKRRCRCPARGSGGSTSSEFPRAGREARPCPPSRGPGGGAGEAAGRCGERRGATEDNGCLREALLPRPGDCSGNPAELVPGFRLSHGVLIRCELCCSVSGNDCVLESEGAFLVFYFKLLCIVIGCFERSSRWPLEIFLLN